METKRPGARVLRAKSFAHLLPPDAPSGAVLGDFLEKIVVRVEKERKQGREFVHCQTTVDTPLDVLDAVSQSERKLLDCSRTGLTDVITADRNRIESRRVACAEFERVDHQAQRRLGWIDVLLLRDIFLENVILEGACKQLPTR